MRCLLAFLLKLLRRASSSSVFLGVPCATDGSSSCPRSASSKTSRFSFVVPPSSSSSSPPSSSVLLQPMAPRAPSQRQGVPRPFFPFPSLTPVAAPSLLLDSCLARSSVRSVVIASSCSPCSGGVFAPLCCPVRVLLRSLLRCLRLHNAPQLFVPPSALQFLSNVDVEGGHIFTNPVHG